MPFRMAGIGTFIAGTGDGENRRIIYWFPTKIPGPRAISDFVAVFMPGHSRNADAENSDAIIRPFVA